MYFFYAYNIIINGVNFVALDDVYYNVTSSLSHNRANVVLLHDIKSITVGALKDIIKFGREYGYEFSAIDMNTYMVRHSVNN